MPSPSERRHNRPQQAASTPPQDELVSDVRALLRAVSGDASLIARLDGSSYAVRMVNAISTLRADRVTTLSTMLLRLGCTEESAIEQFCRTLERGRASARSEGQWNDTLIFVRAVCASRDSRLPIQVFEDLIDLTLHHPGRHLPIRAGCRISRSDSARSIGWRALKAEGDWAILEAVEHVAPLLRIGAQNAAQAAWLVHLVTGEPTTHREQLAAVAHYSPLPKDRCDEILAAIADHDTVSLADFQTTIVDEVRRRRSTRVRRSQINGVLSDADRDEALRELIANEPATPASAPTTGRDSPQGRLLVDALAVSSSSTMRAIGRDDRSVREMLNLREVISAEAWITVFEVVRSSVLTSRGELQLLIHELQLHERAPQTLQEDRAICAELIRSGSPFRECFTLIKLRRWDRNPRDDVLELVRSDPMTLRAHLAVVEPIVLEGKRDTALRVWHAYLADPALATRELANHLMSDRGIPDAWYWHIRDWAQPHALMASAVMNWLRRTDIAYAALGDSARLADGRTDDELRGKIFLLIQEKPETVRRLLKIMARAASGAKGANTTCHELIDLALGGAPVEMLESWVIVAAPYKVSYATFAQRSDMLSSQWREVLPSILEFLHQANPNHNLQAIFERIVQSVTVAPSFERCASQCRRFLKAIERRCQGDAETYLELAVAWCLADRPTQLDGGAPFLEAAAVFNAARRRGLIPPDRSARALAYCPPVFDGDLGAVSDLLLSVDNTAAIDRHFVTWLISLSSSITISDNRFSGLARSAAFALGDSVLLAQLARRGADPSDPRHARLSGSDLRNAMNAVDPDTMVEKGIGTTLALALDGLAARKRISGLCHTFLNGTKRARTEAFRTLQEIYPIDTTLAVEGESWELPHLALLAEALSVMRQGVDLARSIQRNRLDFYEPTQGSPSLMQRIANEIAIDTPKSVPGGIIEFRGLWAERLVPNVTRSDKRDWLRARLPELRDELEDAQYTRFLSGAGILAVVPPDDRRYYIDGRHVALITMWNSAPILGGTFLVPSPAVSQALLSQVHPAAMARELAADGEMILTLTTPALIGGLRNAFRSEHDPIFKVTSPPDTIFRDADGRPMLGPLLRFTEQPGQRDQIRKEVIAASHAVHDVASRLFDLATLYRFAVTQANRGDLSDPDGGDGSGVGVPGIATLYEFRGNQEGVRPTSLRSRPGLPTASNVSSRVEVFVDSLAVEINGRLVGYLPDRASGEDPEVHQRFRDLTGEAFSNSPEVSFSFGNDVDDTRSGG